MPLGPRLSCKYTQLSTLHIVELTFDIFSIVAIHGLNGHRDRTWIAGNGTNWLKDLLPEKIPNVRIFSYGYDAKTHGFVSQQYLHDHGNALVADMSLVRRSTAVSSLHQYN